MSALARVEAALEVADCGKQGRDWTCPAHDDQRASLGVAEGEGGRVLLHCHAGCSIDDVLGALGLTAADLFIDAPAASKREIVATYDYQAEDGALLYQAIRYRPKGFAQRRPDGRGGWTWRLSDTRRVLYRLPQVIAAARAGQTIWIVEGERDVESLERAGHVATCNPGGAGKWRADYAEILHGTTVRIIADRDDPGRKHASEVARSLDGIAASVTALEPIAPHKDVSDLLAAGGSLDDLIPLDGGEPQAEPADDWLTGSPMDPIAVPTEPLPSLPGIPFITSGGSSAVIVGPTGGGRSALVQACLYDAGRAGQRCAYLGGEITREEFNARSGWIAERRGDQIDKALRAQLAAVRYLDLASTIVRAWGAPEQWIKGVSATFDIVIIDPLSAVASAIDLDFDKSNADYVRAFDRLIQPLTARGVTVIIVENVGHDPEAKRRAKGASAKGDRADLTFSCSATTNPAGLAIRAQKVRSIRASFGRGDEWLFERDTQRIVRRTDSSPEPESTFRPTAIMQRVSELVERDAGLSANAIRTAIGGRSEYVTLALQLLVSEGYVEVERDGQAHRHRSLKPYRDTTASTESQPGPNQVPDPLPGTESTESPLRSRGHGDGPGANGHGGHIPPANALTADCEAA